MEVRSVSRPPLLRGQRGLFATRAWKAGEVLGEYEGEIVLFADVADTSYTVGINADGWMGYGVDGKRLGNRTRFINHYGGGVADGPNCRYDSSRAPRVDVVIVVDVNPGDQFVADYGYEF
nr:SET domain-containing protein [Oceanusvirus sp.]